MDDNGVGGQVTETLEATVAQHGQVAGEIATGKNIRAAQQVAQQAAIDRYRRAVGVGDGQAERFFSRRLAMAEDLEEHRVEPFQQRSEEHTSELQSRENLVCRLLLEKKKK